MQAVSEMQANRENVETLDYIDALLEAADRYYASEEYLSRPPRVYDHIFSDDEDDDPELEAAIRRYLIWPRNRNHQVRNNEDNEDNADNEDEDEGYVRWYVGGYSDPDSDYCSDYDSDSEDSDFED